MALAEYNSDVSSFSVPIGDGGNPSPSGEARSSKSPKGTSYPPTEVGGFKNEAGALNRIQFDAPAVTPRLEAGGCLVPHRQKLDQNAPKTSRMCLPQSLRCCCGWLVKSG